MQSTFRSAKCSLRAEQHLEYTLPLQRETRNKHDGYNRGSSVSQGSSGATQSTNETITFKQGQGGRVNQVTVKIPKGYRKTNMRSNGEPIFTNGKNYITPDNTGYNGGIWKMAKTIKGLGKKPEWLLMIGI